MGVSEGDVESQEPMRSAKPRIQVESGVMSGEWVGVVMEEGWIGVWRVDRGGREKR